MQSVSGVALNAIGSRVTAGAAGAAGFDACDGVGGVRCYQRGPTVITAVIIHPSDTSLKHDTPAWIENLNSFSRRNRARRNDSAGCTSASRLRRLNASDITHSTSSPPLRSACP